MCGAGGAGGAGPSSALWIGNGGGCGGDSCGGRGGDGRGANGSQAFPRFTGGGRARGPLVPFVQPRYFAQAIEQFNGQPWTQVTCVSRIQIRREVNAAAGLSPVVVLMRASGGSRYFSMASRINCRYGSAPGGGINLITF